MMIKLMIFDLCGVVFHCEEPPFFRFFADKYKYPLGKIEEVFSLWMKRAELGDISLHDAMTNFLNYFKVNEDSEKMVEKMLSFKKLNPAIIKILSILRKKYKLAYLTNSTVELMDQSEVKLPIKHHFDFGIISEDIKVRKPDPKGFRVILEQFNVIPEEAVFIDDAEKNLSKAGIMGIHTIRFEDAELLVCQLRNLKVEI